MPSVDTAPGTPLLIRKMSCLSLLVRWGKGEDHSSERPGECGGQGRVCDSFWICLCKVYNFVISRDLPKANSSSELQLHEFAGCFVLGFFKEKEKKVVRSLKAFSAVDTSQSNRMGTVGREDSGSSGPMMIILLWIIGGRERVCKEASGIDWSFHWKGRENTFTSSFFSPSSFWIFILSWMYWELAMFWVRKKTTASLLLFFLLMKLISFPSMCTLQSTGLDRKICPC